MNNVDQLDGEERHKACFQLMFFSEIEEEFRQLMQRNDKTQNKKVMEQNKRLESQLKEMEQENQRWERERALTD